ncbi:hypothetical protein H7H37_16765 [Mycolicibacterium insubricum]|nr:hypothetical protein [Mycolicibacterium insubricum]
MPGAVHRGVSGAVADDGPHPRVHGLGDTVALSVHAASSIDLDDYLSRLALALPSA